LRDRFVGEFNRDPKSVTGVVQKPINRLLIGASADMPVSS